MGGIFINYRAVDDGYAAALVYKGLVPVFGENRVFYDPQTVKAGEDVPDEIRRKLKSSTVLVVGIGPDWFTVKDAEGNRRLDNRNDFVRWEIRKAFKWNLKVVPLLLEKAEFPADPRLSEDIKSLARMKRKRLRREHSEADLAELITELRRYVPTLPERGGAKEEPSPAATVIRQDRHLSFNGEAKNSIITMGDADVQR